jgi:hypothetical protein
MTLDEIAVYQIITPTQAFGDAIDSSELAARLAGNTSLANWLKALFRKSAPDATALSEINSGGGTYLATTDSAEALSEALADIEAATLGAGSISTTITVKTTGGDPLDGAAVWITTDAAGTNVIAGKLYTNASGVATFMLDAGSYYVWRQLAGMNFTNPQAITVS